MTDIRENIRVYQARTMSEIKQIGSRSMHLRFLDPAWGHQLSFGVREVGWYYQSSDDPRARFRGPFTSRDVAVAAFTS